MDLDVPVQTTLYAFLRAGQSIWLDDLSRRRLRDGRLKQAVQAGLRGLTSNPTIFQQSIEGGDYDEAIAAAPARSDDLSVFERLAVEDVQAAADVFRGAYEDSDAEDGYVSFEVSPLIARDTDAAVREARRLWQAIARPNAMIKIPGTREGWPAIEQLLYEGINVNITLLFSVQHYQEVAAAYTRALARRAVEGKPLRRVASVASFFVSRVDTEVDRRLREGGADGGALCGHAAIANAQLAYARFRSALHREEWRRVARAGARPQRLLWASTGTKDPRYPPLFYVEALIAPDTVNTVPPATLDALQANAVVKPALSDDATGARSMLARIGEAGVDLADVARTLENEGIEKFARSYHALLHAIGEKRRRLAQG